MLIYMLTGVHANHIAVSADVVLYAGLAVDPGFLRWNNLATTIADIRRLGWLRHAGGSRIREYGKQLFSCPHI